MVETNPDSRPRPHAQPSRRAHITRTSARAQSSCSAAEHQDVVHCTRVAFKESAKRYAFDDLIRAYVLPPFFVYGYLLPKFIWFWARHPALWVGMIVLLTLKAFHIRKRFVATHKNIKI